MLNYFAKFIIFKIQNPLINSDCMLYVCARLSGMHQLVVCLPDCVCVLLCGWCSAGTELKETVM